MPGRVGSLVPFVVTLLAGVIGTLAYFLNDWDRVNPLPPGMRLPLILALGTLWSVLLARQVMTELRKRAPLVPGQLTLLLAHRLPPPPLDEAITAVGPLYHTPYPASRAKRHQLPFTGPATSVDSLQTSPGWMLVTLTGLTEPQVRTVQAGALRFLNRSRWRDEFSIPVLKEPGARRITLLSLVLLGVYMGTLLITGHFSWPGVVTGLLLILHDGFRLMRLSSRDPLTLWDVNWLLEWLIHVFVLVVVASFVVNTLMVPTAPPPVYQVLLVGSIALISVFTFTRFAFRALKTLALQGRESPVRPKPPAPGDSGEEAPS